MNFNQLCNPPLSNDSANINISMFYALLIRNATSSGASVIKIELKQSDNVMVFFRIEGVFVQQEMTAISSIYTQLCRFIFQEKHKSKFGQWKRNELCECTSSVLVYHSMANWRFVSRPFEDYVLVQLYKVDHEQF